ncbi:MAG: hypothetical protein K2M34_02340 [Alphaproteobacteria bacterium]|nr:hypothetical protein [Alphaproteobacteria bacterium]
MQDKYEHIILDLCGNVERDMSVSMTDLRDMLIAAKSINEYYRRTSAAEWICNKDTLDDLTRPDGTTERWRLYNKHGYPKIQELWVSNLGRIKITDDVGTRIAPLVEDYHRDKSLNADILNTSKIGYLIVRDYPELKVWRLVAETWLNPPPEPDWTVHHITNDGYDNRPENLIWLPWDVHSDNVHRVDGKRLPGKELDYKPGCMQANN